MHSLYHTHTVTHSLAHYSSQHSPTHSLHHSPVLTHYTTRTHPPHTHFSPHAHDAHPTQAYRPLAGQLFNISFISIWDELFGNESHDVVEEIPLINGLELALHSPQIPPYIMNALLNLAEFMVSLLAESSFIIFLL